MLRGASILGLWTSLAVAALAGQPQPTVAVIGAGFTGIELALEMRDRLAAHGAPDRGADASIVLIDRAGNIRGYYDGLIPEDMEALVADLKRVVAE